ncbi:hypothetical protein FRB97_006165 [Tulasnella sp. 331]|nr:hypothetical protein FRB97_006165 [Tulasnella sp. 331]KAG8889366.1 hypothetical protein FRB98_004650 [Tulasnella sp. 332]
MFSSSPAHPSHHRTQLSAKDSHHRSITAAGLPSFPKPATNNPRKRSASAANLLTPPTSPNKVKHRSKKGFTDSDDEDGRGALSEEDELDSPEARVEKRVGAGSKTRKSTRTVRTTRAVPAGTLLLNAGRALNTSGIKPEASVTAPVSTQVDKMNLDSGGSPVTPKKATPRRRDGMDISPARLPPRPTTPTPSWRMSKNGKGKCTAGPVRDSPNNPFLRSSPRIKAPKESILEKPTVTYVFRGVKVVYANPAYNVPAPVEGDASTLPPQHPDFSPDLLTAPKLLWSAGSDDDEDEDAAIASQMPPLKFQAAPQAGASSPVRSRPATKRRRLTAEKDEDVFGGVQKGPNAILL